MRLIMRRLDSTGQWTTFRSGYPGERVRVNHDEDNAGFTYVSLLSAEEERTYIGISRKQEFLCPNGLVHVTTRVDGAEVDGIIRLARFELVPRRNFWGRKSFELDMRWYDRRWQRFQMPFGRLVPGQELILSH